MDKKSAIHLIEDTFNAKFDEDRFTLFIKNFLNDIEPKSNNYSGNYIWDDHKEHINAYKRIGKYIDPDGDALDVLIVEVKSVAKLERARTSLRNFVIKHLSKFNKDFALVAFYSKEDDGEDWRFSFIKLEHQSYLDEEKQKVKTRKEFTPAKRYSFLVGKYEQAHTAKIQILPLLQNIANNPTVEDIESAFSIEKVTDEFFGQYKDLYVKLFEHFENDSHIQAELKKANIDNARFTKKLLGQIVFLYFLQKKGWMGVPENQTWGNGNKRFIQDLFDNCKRDKENYFRDYLQYLFYEALAKERNNENSYYKKFDCRIPFLNGGLFEAEYDWENANITIPETLFRNTEKNKAGDIGTGVLDVFDRYNFTIKEDEPLDKEVAVDPEMLGKVFENMLEITERKSKGAFYTPREIVHYMCQESLIHYLDNCLNSSPPLKRGVPEGGGGFTINNLPHLKTFRKNLRNNLTPAEATLWKLLQKKQLDGRKFRRQHSVANYILDFYCPSEKLAIELDGQGHFEENQAEYDKERDLFLKHCGIKVLRFENKLVWDNTEGLLQAVRDEFGWWKNQPPRPADTPPLKGGEVKKADIEAYIREGHFALENDQRVANKGKETKDYKYQIPESIRQNADLLDQKLTEIRICDPAIGSGAFPVGLLHELVNAQLVLKPHLSNKYLKKKLDGFGFEFHESINESRYVYRLKRHIIQESIYGVDIDASAIDIARLRLWLSLVVDEDDLDPIETLPNLDYKIVCGNSLIGMPENSFRDLKVEKELEALKEQFYDETNESKKKVLRTRINSKIRELLDSAESFAGYKIDFDFKLYFSEVWHEKGGFDVVIGNPPYVDYRKIDSTITKKIGFQNVGKNRPNLYIYFIDKGNSILNKNGSLTFINPNQFLSIDSGLTIRRYLLQNRDIKFIKDVSYVPVFKNASTYTCVWLFSVAIKNENISISKFEDLTNLYSVHFKVNQNQLSKTKGYLIPISPENPIIKRLDVIKKKLRNIGNLFWGTSAAGYGKKKISHKIFVELDNNLKRKYIPIVQTSDIKKYCIEWKGEYLPKDVFSENVLVKFKFDKIVIGRLTKRLQSSIDFNNFGVGKACVIVNIDYNIFVLVSLLNSSVINYWYLKKFESTHMAGGYIRFDKPYLEQIPIPQISKKEQLPFELLVDYVISTKSLSDELTFNFFEQLLDAIVFELYFPEELKSAGKEILKHLGDLKPITDEMSEEEKLAIIQAEFERLYDPNHPVRNAIETLDSIEEVRIIKEALK